MVALFASWMEPCIDIPPSQMLKDFFYDLFMLYESDDAHCPRAMQDIADFVYAEKITKIRARMTEYVDVTFLK